MKVRGWLILGQALNDRGCLHERIVRAKGEGTMTRCALDGYPSPIDTLLADMNDQLPVVARPEMQPAGLSDHVVGIDGVALVLGEPDRSHTRVGLLVCDPEQDQIALGGEAGVGEMAYRNGHRGGEVQHVDRPTTPDLAVDDLPAEGVVAPSVGGDRHDIGVAHKAQAGSGGI